MKTKTFIGIDVLYEDIEKKDIDIKLVDIINEARKECGIVLEEDYSLKKLSKYDSFKKQIEDRNYLITKLEKQRDELKDVPLEMLDYACRYSGFLGFDSEEYDNLNYFRDHIMGERSMHCTFGKIEDKDKKAKLSKNGNLPTVKIIHDFIISNIRSIIYIPYEEKTYNIRGEEVKGWGTHYANVRKDWDVNSWFAAQRFYTTLLVTFFKQIEPIS